VALVVVHMVLTIAHAVVHLGAHVQSSVAQLVFIAVVIVAGPIVGLYWYLRRKARRGGAAVLAVSMVGALVFGVYFHLLSNSDDNVTHAHPGVGAFWLSGFVSSAVALAVVDLVGTLFATGLVIRWRSAS
jgi:hypothetical protein